MAKAFEINKDSSFTQSLLQPLFWGKNDKSRSISEISLKRFNTLIHLKICFSCTNYSTQIILIIRL